jgi:hypothetical protein
MMMNGRLGHPALRIRGVRGNWIGGGTLSSNYDALQAALQSGSTAQGAAMSTFTGKMAAKCGFSVPRIVVNEAGKVVVEFTR